MMNRRNFLKGFLATATVVALAPLAPVVELSVDKATFDQIAMITLQKYRKVLADAILNSSRVKWEMLYARQCMNESKYIREPIIYA